MRKFLMLAAALVALAASGVARADDFSGSSQSQASLNAQATNAEAADPTASGSLRDHGQP